MHVTARSLLVSFPGLVLFVAACSSPEKFVALHCDASHIDTLGTCVCPAGSTDHGDKDAKCVADGAGGGSQGGSAGTSSAQGGAAGSAGQPTQGSIGGASGAAGSAGQPTQGSIGGASGAGGAGGQSTACTVDMCSTVPVATCVDATTRRLYTGAGTCTSGTCDYPHTDETCPASCVSGTCVTPQAGALSARLYSTCARRKDGAVLCWGRNESGQLGNANTANQPSPLVIGGLDVGVTGVSAGGVLTCVRIASGGVRCWGSNEYGQLGNGTTTASLSPVNVVSLGVTRDVSVGAYFACAVTATGGAKCWGYSGKGNLGGGLMMNTTSVNSTPVDVDGLTSGVASVVAGYNTACALLESGEVKCWGASVDPAAGNAVKFNFSPVAISGLSAKATSIAVGNDGYACAVLSTGSVSCWGFNTYGQLGDGTKTPRASAADVAGLSDVVSIAAGGGHTCALTSSHKVKCWGLNNGGQLGNESKVDSMSPVDVLNLPSDVVRITAGTYYSCAMSAGGGVLCWGDNSFGQLGSTTMTTSTPTDVVGL